jgi:hypothetical protein
MDWHQIWNDPVWSKVISGVVVSGGVALLTFLLRKISPCRAFLAQLIELFNAWARTHLWSVVLIACLIIATSTWAAIEMVSVGPLKRQLELKDRHSKETPSIIIDGPLTGTWELKSWTYHDDFPYPKIPSLDTVDLKQGESQVVGTLTEKIIPGKRGPKAWTFSGYLRQRFLTFSYGGKAGGLGTGAYDLQSEVVDIYWGHAVKVECIGRDALYVRCPCLMYRVGRADQAIAIPEYRDFLNKECERVKSPQKCK